MDAYFVAEWSVLEQHVPTVEAVLAALSEHMHVDHDEVLELRAVRLWWGARPRRAYQWFERFADVATIEQHGRCSTCHGHWLEITSICIPGTHTGSIWNPLGDLDWRRP